jgi:hypothetical protein
MNRALALSAVVAAAIPVAGAGAAPKPPAAAGAPTIKAAPAIVVFGATTTISGKAGGAKQGATIALQRDPYPLGDGWQDFKTTTVGKGGAYSFTVPPFIATSYRVVAEGTPSAGALVKVRPSVGLSLGHSGGLTRFYGSVKPARDGAHASIQRKTPSGTWKTVKTATLKDAGTTRSTYSARLTVRSAGTYRTKLVAAAGYLTGTSRERAVSAR